jgi:hypothetical protein
MSNTPDGLMLPTAKSYVPGSGNPRDSALMSQQQMNESQNNLNKTVGGRKRRYKGKGGATNEVAVPQFQMQYTPQGGPGTNPNDQITNMSSTSMQSTAWKADDNLAAKMGGTRKRKRGGNPNWNWGCYSGGKRRKSRRNKKKTKRYHKRR